MHFYILFLAAFVAVVSAFPQGGGGGGHHEHYIDYQGHPSYHFDYSVHDPKHHDFHHQWEHRDGDKVKGEYGLHQPDGKQRIVKYEADKHGGFRAEVKYEGQGHSFHGAF